MKYLELLSPAKNLEIGKAAIESGADAVYIGASVFGARTAAGNNLEDIEELTSYAHIFNAKVYVTINTLLFDEELMEVEDLFHQLYNIGVDAIIIQDLGILEMDLPPIALHASTQMHNFSKQKVDFLKNIGLRRVVLARELSLDQISEIHNTVPDIELECFIHGAICAGLSGQCYLSHSITGRSGNRGVCAQPCRSKYDLLNYKGEFLIRNKHLLSPKDLNASELIPAMIEAGVRSFKIEGRLKDIDYVKNITSFYRLELDRYISEHGKEYSKSSIGKIDYNFTPKPEKSFNRGFTHFYLKGREGVIGNINSAKSLGEYLGRVKKIDSSSFILDTKVELSNGDGLCYINKEGDIDGFLVNGVNYPNIIPNKRLNIEIGTEVYRNLDFAFNKMMITNVSRRSIGINMILSETENGFSLKAIDETGIECEKTILAEKQLANNLEDYDQKLLKLIDSLGNTPFHLEGFKNQVKDKYFFQSSLIKSLRREVCEKLLAKREEEYEVDEVYLEKNNYPYPEEELDYRANITNEKAKNFYLRHGVKKLEYGVEKTLTNDEIILMSSRHCLRYQLGQCLKRENVSPEYQGDLFLQDNRRRFKLSFDCKNCMMEIS